VIDYTLNIVGGEWLIIIFVALVLILGTNKLPEAAKKLGKAMNEYKKAKDGIQDQMKDYTKENLQVNGPVADERQKLDKIAKSLGIDSKNKSDDELRNIISSKIGIQDNLESKSNVNKN